MENNVRADEREIDPRIDLAVQRTELAWDRTLLAWIRTALSLMASGVAFDKGTQLMHQARLIAGTAWVRSGHFVGLSLTGVSTLLLVAVTWNHMQGLRAIARMNGRTPPRVTAAELAAVLVILLGGAVMAVLVRGN